MSKYNIVSEKQKLEQIICNIISYVLLLYRQGNITEKAKNDILNICNSDILKVGENNEQRRNNYVKRFSKR